MKQTYPYIVILLFTLLTFSCQKNQQEKKFRIAFSQCTDDAWRDVMNSEMRRELSFHPEIDFEMKVSPGNTNKQIEQINELIASNPDLIIIAPNESAPLTDIVEEIYKKGIPVILIDRTIGSDQYTAYIGGDNYEIGQTAADYIANQFDGKGEIIEIRFSLTISPSVGRQNGFREGLKKYPNLKVVAEIDGEGPLGIVDNLLPSIMKEHPEAKIVFGFTDLLAETAYKVADEIGKSNEMFFVGVDGIPGTGRGIQAVEDGVLDASLLYPTGGSEAIQLALAILNRLPFERKNLLPTTVINASNARILHHQMRRVESLQEDIDAQFERAEELIASNQKQRNFNLVLILGLVLFTLLGGLLWRALFSKQRAYKLLEKKNQEVIEKQEEVIKISEELQEATKAKVNFFTNISHEFRTPLTLILAFTDDLLHSSSKKNKDGRNNIQPIRQNVFRLLRLVNQLMDFRKIESDKMLVRASEHNLIDFIKQIMNSYYIMAERRGIDFKLITRHDKLMVWLDPNMIDKALFNILSNAFKFTPDSGKITISVNVDTFENKVKIKIEDSGKGMSKKDGLHIFEPFYQGGNHKVKGTGLGLPFSMSLVKLHHGNILVKSIKNKGSRFTIILPLGNDHFSKEQLVNDLMDYKVDEAYSNFSFSGDFALQPKSTFTDMKKKEGFEILLIEDNEELLSFLQKRLNPRYNISTAMDGTSGLKKALELNPDLIVCDVILPEQNGIEVTEALKSDLRTSHIPVILLTARHTVEHQLEGTKAGADAYMIKPFNIQLLEEKISNLLSNRQKLREVFGNNLQTFSQDSHLSSIDQDFLRQFTICIDENYAKQDFQITDLCEAMNLSRSQLYRKVKSLVWESPSDFIKNIRLKKAETLLLEGQFSISEIAYQVGYSSPDYFTTVFKSKHGIVPSQFRESNKE